MVMYGEAYQVYGAGDCPRCLSPHRPEWHIRENNQSRFRLMQLLAEMSTQASPQGRRVVIHAGIAQKFMVGLLMANGMTFVTVSANNLANQAFTRAANRKGYIICPARTAKAGNHETVAHWQIPAEMYQDTRPVGGGLSSAPGDCCAPRLIERAFEPAFISSSQNAGLSDKLGQVGGNA